MAQKFLFLDKFEIRLACSYGEDEKLLHPRNKVIDRIVLATGTNLLPRRLTTLLN